MKPVAVDAANPPVRTTPRLLFLPRGSLASTAAPGERSRERGTAVRPAEGNLAACGEADLGWTWVWFL